MKKTMKFYRNAYWLAFPLLVSGPLSTPSFSVFVRFAASGLVVATGLFRSFNGYRLLPATKALQDGHRESVLQTIGVGEHRQSIERLAGRKRQIAVIHSADFSFCEHFSYPRKLSFGGYSRKIDVLNLFHIPFFMRFFPLLFVLLIPLLAHAEQLTVTPYRPTVSNPAELSALRHLEVEFGAQSNQPGKQEERNSLPFLLKYPFADQWGLLVGGEAWIRSRNEDGTISGFGNTSVLIKHYHLINPSLAVGFEAGATLPSARQSLGQGRTDYLGNLIVSQDIDDLRIDVNAGVTRKGFKEDDLDRYRYNWAIAASHPINDLWGIAGEFSGVLAKQQKSTSQFLASLNYLMTPQLMLDFGGTVGMTSVTDDYTVFAGFSLLIAP